MSALGSVLDAIAAHARTALSLSVGSENVERRIDDPYSVANDDMPHGYVHSPAERIQRERFEQWVRTFEAGVLLVIDDTQENAITKLEAFEALIVGDPTLGGLVIGAYVSDAALVETFGSDRRIAQMTVAWSKET